MTEPPRCQSCGRFLKRRTPSKGRGYFPAHMTYPCTNPACDWDDESEYR